MDQHLIFRLIVTDFLDKLFTNELWELLAIETNIYARQNNVMLCSIGFSLDLPSLLIFENKSFSSMVFV